jgi:alanyl-tRNA synthetase
MKAQKVREKFLEYFEARDHKIVPSAPLVIKDDPTLMFTNAGMNQFKDWFLGSKKPAYPRVADTQKCLRVSGKHNDLEEVGVDTYHHTMFEMLGNWSFGDYFKKEAIQWSWELLTSVYKIAPDRLYVTVFEGSEKEGLAFDKESFEEWKKWIPEERILKGNRKDNFWEMGDTGPCGPCSEIHADLRSDADRKKTPGKTLVNTGHPQVIEIWNNVFMEFNRKADGKLEKLPQQHVDTGMGFERLCMVLQGKQSTYDTDVFQPLIEKIEDISGLRYQSEAEGKSHEVINIGMRVVADHIRAISFSIADGQLPSNTGAGYVIRRILRRAVRYGYQSLALKEPFLHRLVPVLCHQMGDAFPELNAQKIFIEKVIREEELSFFKTLESGLKRIDQVCIALSTKSGSEKKIDGKTVFELYDTYGFPLDLTALIARGYKLEIDEKGFREELEKQKNRSREDRQVDKEDWVEINPGESEFVGYDTIESPCKILRYRKIKQKGKEMFQLVLDKTPFYGESGGQVGDVGTLERAGEKIEISDTKKENNVHIHVCSKIPGKLDGIWQAIVNPETRKSAQKNHSATHLLHAALRSVLGSHVEQKGSLVHPDYLRFDFSHFSKVGTGEVEKIEALVNEKIAEMIPVSTRVMPLEEAKKSGAMALFGEKYGERVRVVSMDPKFSIELCGGTHVGNTSEIGRFKIVGESAVAAGIRRIEAVSGEKAEAYFNSRLELLEKIMAELGNPSDPLKEISALQLEIKELRAKVESFLNREVNALNEELSKSAESVNGIRKIVKKVSLESPEAIKNLAFGLREKFPDLFLVLGANIKGKASLTVAISDALVKEKNLNAAAIVKELGKEIQGGGGGQAFYATAGGSNIDGLDKALKKAHEII